MKRKIITGSGSVIALLYTLLMILAVGGFDRAGVINSTIDFLGFENGNIYGILLFLLCVTVLVLYYILISKDKNNVIGGVLIFSFIIGAVLLMLVVKITSVQKYLFDFYISWFYHGVHYEGEDKIPQVFSFISRLMAFCFCWGGIISLFIVKYINRSLIKI
ncbi:hypothetical protein [Klebsiella michiganensis]|uniref:hypothetical protein n=1 Tax=Klebsiella TaxID=570 RepID=UPI00189C56FC|nr:hypothetical protein [Klebsiella michiganensis]MBZ7394675.1 hypothetical protein [Klebsiella michiganensis]QZG74859.1 hypothetical protein Km24235_1695 [Klebsiella michiganensis]UKS48444.1 hypothetical protein L3249_08325 [Klebsiella michiganensis]HEM8797388.1 hypothetical protein [Klebsiella michiganensis]